MERKKRMRWRLWKGQRQRGAGGWTTGSESKEERKKNPSTWPKGSWALRGEVEALRTEEGEVVGGAGGCWEERRKGIKLEMQRWNQTSSKRSKYQMPVSCRSGFLISISSAADRFTGLSEDLFIVKIHLKKGIVGIISLCKDRVHTHVE